MFKKKSRNVNKILIIIADGLGDYMLLTPVIRALKIKYPSAQISILAKEYLKEFLEAQQLISKVITNPLAGRYGHQTFFNLLNHLRKINFDLILNTRIEPEYAWLTFLCWAKISLGDRSRILHSFMYNHGTFIKMHDSRHEISNNLILLKKVGADKTTPEMMVNSTPQAQQNISEILSGINKTAPIITFQVSSGGGNKPWLPEKFGALARELTKKLNANIVLIGTGKDLPIAEIILSICPKNVMDLTGKISLLELTALLQKTNLHIGVDSGPMHIASALKKPIV
ncbi:MAG: glycosyltransferase family 9 protein, partial [bacterium]